MYGWSYLKDAWRHDWRCFGRQSFPFWPFLQFKHIKLQSMASLSLFLSLYVLTQRDFFCNWRWLWGPAYRIFSKVFSAKAQKCCKTCRKTFNWSWLQYSFDGCKTINSAKFLPRRFSIPLLQYIFEPSETNIDKEYNTPGWENVVRKALKNVL